MIEGPTVDHALLLRAVREIRDHGLDVSSILRAAGFESIPSAEVEARVGLKDYLRLVELAETATGDECFGVKVGLNADPEDLGVLGYAVRHCSTVAQALEIGAQYMGIQQDRTRFEVAADNGLVRCGYELLERDISGRDVDAEGAVGLIVGLADKLIGEPLPIVEVRLTRAAPREPHRFERLLGGPVRFAAPKAGLDFSSDFMNRRIHDSDHRLAALLAEYMSERVGPDLDRDPVVLEVEERIAAVLPTGAPKLQDIARACAMSPRTLQRRLGDQDCTFGELVEETRRGLAFDYLTRPNISLMEVTMLLGYADFSSFSRAFRRWTGESPGAYARRVRAEPR